MRPKNERLTGTGIMEEAANIMFFSREQHNSRAHAARDAAGEFEEVYLRYIKPVYAFVSYRVIHRSTAEDITSQIFEKAWRGFDRYDTDQGALSTWIFTIARNCLTDHFRATARNAAETELGENDSPDYGVDPGKDFKALELRSELEQALAGLESNELEIVALKFGGSMNNREIGRLLEISESNVGTILYRSLKKMKSQLEGDQ